MTTDPATSYKDGDIVHCQRCGKSLRIRTVAPGKIVMVTPDVRKSIALRCQACGYVTCEECSTDSNNPMIPVCPSCGKTGGPYFFPPLEKSLDEPAPVEAPAQSAEIAPTPKNTEMKKCPMCAEEIPLADAVCQYCGTLFIVTGKGYCQTCHTVRPADATGHCAVCGGELTDWRIESRLKDAPSPRAESVQPEPVPASKSGATELTVLPIKGEGVSNRFGAIFIDVILISLLQAIAITLFYLVSGGIESLSGLDLDTWLAAYQTQAPFLSVPLIWFLYFFLFEWATGTTPGKAASYLRVIKKDGGRIAWWQAAVRALLSIFEDNPIGAVVIWLTPLNQRIGDLLAGTLVVQKEKVHRVIFQPPALSLEFHDYHKVEFARINEGILYKFGAIRKLLLQGLSPDGSPLKLTINGQSFRSEFDLLRRNIESRYGLKFPEKFILWRLILGIALLVMLVILAVLAIHLTSGSPRSENLPAIFATSTPRASSIPRATSTPQPAPTQKSSPTSTPEPVEISFDTIGDYEVGQRVILVGRLALFSSTFCDLDCGLLLENPADVSQKVTIFVDVGDGPNQMARLPDSYTKSDIRVRLDDGTQAVIGYRIRVTGRVCRTTADEPCINRITKIELFQVK